MYAVSEAPQAGVYADLWRKGRYRVRLSAVFLSDIEQVDPVLERFGYHVVDADQYGRSYRHGENSRRTAELDEVEYEGGPVRLILSYGDLEESDTIAGEQETMALYEELSHELGQYEAKGLAADYEWIDDPGHELAAYSTTHLT
jgi:hypothetical protein